MRWRGSSQLIAGVLGVVLLAVVVLVLTGVLPRKLSAHGTERVLHRYTTYKSITCRREAGWLWRGWDSECKARDGQGCGVFDVEVNGTDVTNQDMPGKCVAHR